MTWFQLLILAEGVIIIHALLNIKDALKEVLEDRDDHDFEVG